jgi:hypothetical protein
MILGTLCTNNASEHFATDRDTSAKPSPNTTAIPSIDDLAQIIRQVDGENKLGAGALAEAICAQIIAKAGKGAGE